ncbi:hypothetical protein [Pukyongiella litopenaei]|uniref:Uncharacterized protein n=1 Tax=Pukyongiella litopenaei TaxID=2605946 RepID=A0A2S0MKG4_9RHOB|nr:hypothetical protein [Pukyongiella litopenaei]AVO36356.1 hypothetical protein C6Y53_00605 [Pukyongiella litopenaei]
MAELADEFGGKVDGELIRAADWNGLIAAIETRFDSLRSDLSDARARIDANAADLQAAQGQIEDLQDLATLVRTRYRQLQLSTTRSRFAIGERAEIVARVTDFDGNPLDLSNPNRRPWVDFVTVWGSLKAAPGFTSRAGTGGKTVAVRVNADGEARAMLREETGVSFDEEEELEISAVLATTISGNSVADAFLAASTPAASEIAQAYQVVTNAYERSDTMVMRNYLDGIYLNNPTRTYIPLAPTFTLNWHDEYATVMAFVKPDDSPGTADSAMAAGSIRVTFRDWVYPWIITQYLPPTPPLVDGYVANFTPLILEGLEPAVLGIFNTIQAEVQPLGLLGQQRQYAAAMEAINVLPAAGQPEYFQAMVANVAGGLTVQQGMVYSAAMSPGMAEATGAAKAVAGAGVRGEKAAGAVAATVAAETATSVAAAENRILGQVRAENTKLTNDLLGETGPVRRAETMALDAASKVEKVNVELGRKAGMELVGQLLAARDLG